MNTRTSFFFGLLLLCGLAILVAPTRASATIVWVAIGDHGNAADSQPQGSFGAVDYDYSISKYETCCFSMSRRTISTSIRCVLSKTRSSTFPAVRS